MSETQTRRNPQEEQIELLRSIRAMLYFFVVLAVIGIIAGIIIGLIAATKDPRSYGLVGLRLP